MDKSGPKASAIRVWLSDFFTMPEVTAESEEQFDAYASKLSRRTIEIMMLGVVALTVLLWPTDFLVFRDRPRVFEILQYFRVNMIILAGLTWFGMRKIDWLAQRAVTFFTAMASLASLVVGILFARAGGFDTPYIYGAFAVPFFTVLVVTTLRWRALSTGSLTGFFALGYLASVPGNWDPQLAPQTMLFIGSAVVSSIVVGHLFYSLLRSDFFERKLATQRTVELEITHRQKDQVVEEVWEILREKELEVAQLQKLEAVGRLAGGVAHDFNNFITVIFGYCGFLKSTLNKGDLNYGYVSEIERIAKRASALTEQLLAFSRKQLVERKILDLNGILRELIVMFPTLLSERVKLTTELNADPPFVLADRAQIEQVVMNLAINAGDAMPDGGKLTLRTDNRRLEGRRLLDIPGATVGDYVVLEVADTGCGMDEQVRAHMFEPFFTTKEKGKGTGLGLATVYGIVQQSDGHIHFTSEVGRGTTFTIYLPEQQAPDPNTVEVEATAAPMTPAAHVLVVEDEEVVRHVILATLADAGFSTTQASDPESALELIRNKDHPIDLLLTDIVMPGMNGYELANEAMVTRPALPVLYVTGYTDREVFNNTDAVDGMVVRKPFTRNTLLDAVKRTLDLQ